VISRVALILVLCVLSVDITRAITPIDTNFVIKTVVFFFEVDSSGQVLRNKLVATGFLLMVPGKDASIQYPLLITARHVVDPVWERCPSTNPSRLIARTVNNTTGSPSAATHIPL
jgi:hypothetical protein